MPKVAITGNTFPVKDQLKALGAKWDGDNKAWMIDASKANEARKIVANALKEVTTTKSKPHFPRCADCGASTGGFYRCRDCNAERREGGSRYMGGMSYRDS